MSHYFVLALSTIVAVFLAHFVLRNYCLRRVVTSNKEYEPEFQSDEDAINQLRELLTKIGSSPILLILDDVWSGSEFRLEKFKFDMPKYNILVTSRTIFPKFSFTYN
ncbi:putative disease resistance protein [Quercus suber]|uniref:Disease resistance protein n=1 Tax=Quercus suber TaxID=58331 RepID=A0AAW0J1Y1_QUESU